MIATQGPYVPDRWVAVASFATGIFSMVLIRDPEVDLGWSIAIGLPLSGVIDYGVWRGRGWAFALNVLLGGIGVAFYCFDGVRYPLSWPLEIFPMLALALYGAARLTGRLGPPPTGWRPYAPLGGRVDHREAP